MNDQDGLRIEAAEQYGFEEIDGQDGPGQPGYFCTEAELLAFAKACERAGMAQAAKQLRDAESKFDAQAEIASQTDVNAATALAMMSGAIMTMAALFEQQIAALDAEIAPVKAAAELQFMTAQGYVRDTGGRWTLPETHDCPCGRGETPCPCTSTGEPLCKIEELEFPCLCDDAGCAS